MASSYPIPAEALDDRLGWIGATGSGKTYNAGAGVERLLSSKARVIIIDPLDVWWGLRLREDGKTPSVFAPVIFGGPHGDLPLNERSGALLGETAAKMRESCIISLADFKSTASERRFMLEFLSALDRNATREPVHLVFDEADLWAPQLVLDKEGDANKLLGQMQTIVRRGRVKGFIPWLVTQRPAEISKGVLSQIDGVVAFKLTSSQDRDAIGGWIKGQADAEVGRGILASLPTMQVGQGVVWVPGRGVLATEQFPAKTTFDSSRTPKRGEKKSNATLKALDLGALKDRLATIEAEAKANDPKVLKAEITRLNVEIAQFRKSAPVPAGASAQDLLAAEDRGHHRGRVEGHTEGFLQAKGLFETLRSAASESTALLHRAMEQAAIQLAAGRRAPMSISAPSQEVGKVDTPTRPARVAPAPAAKAAATPVAPAGEGDLTGPQRTVLRAMAWWLHIGKATPSRTQVAVICEWSPNSSNIRDRSSELSRAGLIDRPMPGHMRLTEAGQAAAPTPDVEQTLYESIRRILTGPQRTVFDALVIEGAPIARDDGHDRRLVAQQQQHPRPAERAGAARPHRAALARRGRPSAMGDRMTTSLPKPACRWMPSRKEALVLAIRDGQVTRTWVLATYDLTDDDLRSWERRYDHHGRRGLAVGKLQRIR